jgi:hypothetical protein
MPRRHAATSPVPTSNSSHVELYQLSSRVVPLPPHRVYRGGDLDPDCARRDAQLAQEVHNSRVWQRLGQLQACDALLCVGCEVRQAAAGVFRDAPYILRVGRHNAELGRRLQLEHEVTFCAVCWWTDNAHVGVGRECLRGVCDDTKRWWSSVLLAGAVHFQLGAVLLL